MIELIAYLMHNCLKNLVQGLRFDLLSIDLLIVIETESIVEFYLRR